MSPVSCSDFSTHSEGIRESRVCFRYRGLVAGLLLVLSVSSQALALGPGTSESVSSEAGVSTETTLPEKTSGFFSRDLIADLWSADVHVERCHVPVEGEVKKKIVEMSRVRTNDQQTTLFRVTSPQGNRLGSVVILDEVGKYRPITFFVALDNDRRVLDLQVLVYREHIGQEIESPRFTRQFRNKKLGKSLKLHRGIRNLSGATLSARAAVRAVRRSIATVEVSQEQNLDLVWQALSGSSLAYGEPASAEAVTAAGLEEVSVLRSGMEEKDASVERARPAMGTVLKMEVYGEQALKAVEAAYSEVERLESLHSRWKAGSDVLRVEAAPVGEPVKVALETVEVVEKALAMSRESGGAFDLTLKKDGFRSVKVDREKGTITLLSPGLILDLGGIGKGYALDRAAVVLESHGCSRALLDFGGQLLALDPPPGEKSWAVGIHDPRDGKSVLHELSLIRSSLATTACYERGDHLVQLLDNPSPGRILTTSVLSNSATEADALSTTVALLGQEGARTILDNCPNASAVILVEGESQPRFVGRHQR